MVYECFYYVSNNNNNDNNKNINFIDLKYSYNKSSRYEAYTNRKYTNKKVNKKNNEQMFFHYNKIITN